jgi:hypothetical protein
MYWKYHIEAGDAVEFTHEHNRGWGTVKGWIESSYPEGDDLTVDDVDINEFDLLVQSQNEDYTVNMSDVHNRIAEEDRDGDLPFLGESFRLTGGLEQ